MTEIERALYNIGSAAFEREKSASRRKTEQYVILACEDKTCKCHPRAMFSKEEYIEKNCSVCGEELKIKESAPAP